MDSLLFGYPLSTYLWVICLSSISGTVKYLNEFAAIRQGAPKHGNELLYFFRDVLTRAWTEFEMLLKAVILRMPLPPPDASVRSPTENKEDKNSQSQKG